MKKLIATMVSVIAITLANVSFASENKIFFANKSKCETALAAGEAMFYSPSLKRPAPSSWKRETLKESTCSQMETTQGMQFVVLPPGFEMAQNPGTKGWHAAECTNWTNWLPGNKQSEPIASQMPGVIQAVAGNTVLKGMVCDAKCQQVKICGENGLTPLDKMNEKGEWLCQAPDYKILVVQNGSIRGEVHLKQKGWTVSGNGTLPPAPMDFKTGAPKGSVSGPLCTVQGCSQREQAEFRGEVKAKICGIVVGNVGPKDRLLWLATDEKSGNLQVTELVDEDLNADGTVNKTVLGKKITNKTTKSMLTNRKVSASCDTDQEFVEKEVWHHMVKYFSFPSACVIAGRIEGSRK